MAEPRLLDQARRRIMVLDGPALTALGTYGLSSADYLDHPGFGEILNLTRPDLIERVHAAYLEAGAAAVRTNTSRASRVALERLGIEVDAERLNLEGARIAKRAATAFSRTDEPRFVIGAIGPAGGRTLSDDAGPPVSFAALRRAFADQAGALIQGGADALLLEAQQDLVETRAAALGVRDALAAGGASLPLIVHLAVGADGRIPAGADLETACTVLVPLCIDAIGVVCASGLETARHHVETLARVSPLPMTCVVGMHPEGSRPSEMARALASLATEIGVNMVGGGSGTGPELIREVSHLLVGGPPRKREVVLPVSAASAYRRVHLRQEARPLIIGERLNILGSRVTRALVEACDWQGVAAVAKEQEASGCHLLDVCMAGPDEGPRMEAVIRAVSKVAQAPLVIDSADERVVQTSLEAYPGRAIVNSVNLERGQDRLERILALIKSHGALAVAMTITESGMALTGGAKLEAATRIREIAIGCGLAPEDVLFDCLTLALSTGDPRHENSAKETLDGVRRVKAAFPDSLTILGISNISFGLMPEGRRLLNSVFLHHAVEAGLDAAIINVKDVVPYAEIPAAERDICEDVIFNRGPAPILKFIAWFRRKKTADRGSGQAGE